MGKWHENLANDLFKISPEEKLRGLRMWPGCLGGVVLLYAILKESARCINTPISSNAFVILGEDEQSFAYVHT